MLKFWYSTSRDEHFCFWDLTCDFDVMKKYWDKIILTVIIILAVFIRLYHFQDWLYFAMDQARDAMLVREAYENGVSQLPLLGPRAAGTFLRLGPIFYYFQFLSAKIFHSTDPAVLAYPDFLFSIFSILLFFFFLRFYFQKTIALVLTALLAFNFIAIQYSRFAWNPNAVPFWTLVCFFGILKLASEENKKKKYFWIILSAIGLAVASQLHFLALFVVSAAVFIFLIWSKLIFRLGWKKIILAVLIVALFYFPVIVSDIATKGDNAKQFVWSFLNKPQKHSLVDNFFTNVITYSQHYFFILTSYISKTGKFSLWGGFLLITSGLALLYFRYSSLKSDSQKNFARLVLIWFFVSFLTLFPFTFQALTIKPRFFFSSFFLPFIFFGLIAEYFWKKFAKKKLALFLIVFAGAGIIALNAEAAATWLAGVSGNPRSSIIKERNLYAKQSAGFTFSNTQKLSNYLISRSSKEKKKIYILGNMDYRVPVQYLLENEKPPVDYSIISLKCREPEALYFAVVSAGGGCQSIPSKYFNIFEVTDSKIFGGLMTCELKLKKDLPEYKKEKKIKNNSDGEKKKPKLKRTERVKWENLF